MEEGEEEQWDDNDIIPDGACFNDTAMEETEEEVAAEDEPADDLCQVIRDAQRECKSEKEKIKFERMLEGHSGLLNTVAELEAKEVSRRSMDSLRTDLPTEAARERRRGTTAPEVGGSGA